MSSFRRLLFATDLSECSGWAYAYAARAAARFGADLHVLHVRLTGPEQRAEVGLASSTDEEFCLPMVEGLRETVREVDAPSASAAIVGYAEEHDVDLIVMGARGRSGFGLPSLGHVAEAVVRSAPCAVLTIRARMPTAGIRRVLVPVDFSEPSRVMLAHAKGVAAWFGARIDLLHVIPAPTSDAAAPRERLASACATKTEDVQARLIRFATTAPGPDVAVVLHVRSGVPASAITAFAGENGSDLVMIATRGSTGHGEAPMGSVAERVVRAAPCPVLTVRSPTGALIPEAHRTTAAGAAPDQRRQQAVVRRDPIPV